MTENQQSNTPSQQQMESFEEACRAAGLKLTHQRLQIYRELARASDHPSAEILHRRLHQAMPTLSLDTVYRTLTTLEQHHLIKKVETVDSQAHYEAQTKQHHHLICDTCKEIMDFQWPAFDATVIPEEAGQWGAVKNRSATVYGTCRKCQAMKQGKTTE